MFCPRVQVFRFSFLCLLNWFSGFISLACQGKVKHYTPQVQRKIYLSRHVYYKVNVALFLVAIWIFDLPSGMLKFPCITLDLYLPEETEKSFQYIRKKQWNFTFISILKIVPFFWVKSFFLIEIFLSRQVVKLLLSVQYYLYKKHQKVENRIEGVHSDMGEPRKVTGINCLGCIGTSNISHLSPMMTLCHQPFKNSPFKKYFCMIEIFYFEYRVWI